MNAAATDPALHAIADSIARLPQVARFGAAPALDHASAARLLAAFREIAFPGFHALPHGGAHDGPEAFVAERIPAMRALLAACIAASSRSEGHATDELAAAAAADAVIARIPTVRAMLADDVDAAYRGDPAARSVAEVILCYPGIAALVAHRFAHELWRGGTTVLARMIAELAHSATGIDIHPGASIGQGVFIDHGTGVVIGETCVIGEGCRIYQGVTLGAKSFEREPDGSMRRGYKRHPTLEDDVVVYAGATILGGDTVIGKGSVIAGGVFLTKSVPAGNVVTGPKVELRMISMGGAI